MVTDLRPFWKSRDGRRTLIEVRASYENVAARGGRKSGGGDNAPIPIYHR